MYTPVCFTCVYIMFMHMCLHVSAYGSVCIYVGLPMLVRLSVGRVASVKIPVTLGSPTVT